jgi:ATP-dependent DNA helicase RecG
MKAADLDILLQEGEGVMLEYKEGLSSSFARELVALANTAGGRILLGVRDDGTVKGIADTNELRARIQDFARNCDPPVKILVQRIGKVTVVTVRESDAKPVQCSDGFFWRQGAVTQKLSREEIRDFFRQEGAIRFDLSICPRFRFPDDFDPDKFNAWLHKSNISRTASVEDILVNIDAAERSGGKLFVRNAGVLFFAREPRRFFNQAYITCLLFKGTANVHVLDRKDFAGCVVADIEDSLRFIERNTRTAYRIEKLQREDIPEYPMAALREAITNAVMHRDWFIEGANVFVEIFTDRIEVSSPGGLPKGMKLSDLGQKSVRRNALIADLLHRIAFIEKAGTGIRRMRDGARDQGYPEPEFSADSFFTAVFLPIPAVGEHDAPKTPRKHPSSTPQVTHQVGTKSGPSRAHDEAHDKAHEPLSIVEHRLLKECTGEPQSTPNLLYTLGYKTRPGGFKVALSRLLALGLLEMTIPDKPRSKKQQYRTTTNGRAALESPEKEIQS